METQYKAFSSDVKVVDGERAVSAVISTTSVDRDGEVVIAQGINSKDYESNAVIFYNHAYADFSASPEEKMPVGKCVGLRRNSNSLDFKMVFADRPDTHPPEESWLPDTLLSLYQQGVMRAFSIGFIPTVRKAFMKPQEETLINWFLIAVSFGLGLLALDSMAIETWIYSVFLFIVNVLMTLYLVIRRSQLKTV